MATSAPGKRGEKGQREDVILGGFTHWEELGMEVVQDGDHGRLQYLKEGSCSSQVIEASLLMLLR